MLPAAHESQARERGNPSLSARIHAEQCQNRDLVTLYLKKDGYQVLSAGDGEQALDLARRRRPDLVILDLLLPEMDGRDVCHILRAKSKTPVIMLTARTAEDDKLAGLELGADDYVTKPFSPRELVARVTAVLRRTSDDQESSPSEVHFGNVVVDFPA